MHSEQKYDEMLEILDEIHKYVPRKSMEEKLDIDGIEYTINKEAFHQLLFRGN